jgi:SMC interacting uncharacterized protein involved in chromosome segregation
MNIQTVAENLRNTIAGKEHMLDSHKRYLRGQGITIAETMASETIVKFLEINIDELKRILADVEVCVDQFEKLKKENSDMGWEINPDRMGQ